MSAFAIMGALIGFIAYIPLTLKVRKGLKQNFATFLLWALLDSIAAASIYLNHGNWILPAAYVICCAGVLFYTLRTGTFSWGRTEWFVSALVLACICIWAAAGNREATIASTIAVAIAGIPLMLEVWKHPGKQPIGEYFLFTVANALSIPAGKDWSIEERFYPTVCTALTIVYVLAAARRWLQPRHS